MCLKTWMCAASSVCPSYAAFILNFFLNRNSWGSISRSAYPSWIEKRALCSEIELSDSLVSVPARSTVPLFDVNCTEQTQYSSCSFTILVLQVDVPGKRRPDLGMFSTILFNIFWSFAPFQVCQDSPCSWGVVLKQGQWVWQWLITSARRSIFFAFFMGNTLRDFWAVQRPFPGCWTADKSDATGHWRIPRRFREMRFISSKWPWDPGKVGSQIISWNIFQQYVSK